MLSKTIQLKIIQYFHLFIDIIQPLYLILFFNNKKYDIYFLGFISTIILHWTLLKNECILSYLEKKIMDKNYKYGDRPYEHPYRKIIPDFYMKILDNLKKLTLGVVFLRNLNNIYLFIFTLIILIIKHICEKK